MLEPGGELDLAEEPVGAEGRGQLWVEHLERDRPVVAQVVREVNHGHAPRPSSRSIGVAVGERRFQSCARYRRSRSRLRQLPESRVLSQWINAGSNRSHPAET